MAWFGCDSYQNLNHFQLPLAQRPRAILKTKVCNFIRNKKISLIFFKVNFHLKCSRIIFSTSNNIILDVVPSPSEMSIVVSIKFWPWTSRLLAYPNPIVRTDNKPTFIPDSKQYFYLLCCATFNNFTIIFNNILSNNANINVKRYF